jgi:arylsulfatase A-like enzyme
MGLLFRLQGPGALPASAHRRGHGGQYQPERQYDGYVDDILTDKAVEWLGSRSGDKPFCLLLWFYAPHAPFYRPRRLLDAFNGVPIPKPASFDEDLLGYPGKPRGVAQADNKIGTSTVFNDDPRTLEELVKDHYAGVQSNDEDVGRVLAALDSKGVTDRTAIMLSSDHGFFLGEHGFYDKRLMYEPSIRIPMLLRYPPLVKPGTVRDEMVLNVDAAQTLLDLAGARPAATMQGAASCRWRRERP